MLCILMWNLNVNANANMDNPPVTPQNSPMAKPFPFMKLPTEIKCHIVLSVSRPFLAEIPPDSYPPTHPTPTETAQALQTLFNLCLTSRILYDITLPVLYEEFSLGYNDFDGEYFRPQMGERMVSFTKILLARRDLAAMVKRAFLHPKLVDLMGDENRTMVCTNAKTTLDNEVFEDEAIDILILALMPNLERLVFAGCTWAPISMTVRSVTWKHLKGPELVSEYGWSFGEMEVVKKYEAEIVEGLIVPDPDEDDDL